MKTVFLRALESDNKAATLRMAIHEPEAALGRQRYEVDTASFATVPRSPFAYWVTDQVRRLFRDLPPFEAEGRMVKVGLQTSDDFRFVRGWWALPPQLIGDRWFLFAKGGRFSRFYADVPLAVNWENNGVDIREYPKAFVRNSDYYFRPGLTWPLRGTCFSAQVVPEECLFSIAGKMAFAEGSDLPWLIALFNSQIFDKFIAFFAGKIGGVQYEAGLIQNIPTPKLSSRDKSTLATLASRAWTLKRWFDTSVEISHVFMLPALLQTDGETLARRCDRWAGHVRAAEIELVTIQAEIDELCLDLYRLDQVDRRTITEGFVTDVDDSSEAELEANPGDEQESDTSFHVEALIAELVSWAVGTAFGRFDIRFATGVRRLPGEPEPFAPLPVCSLAMLTGDDGLPLTSAPDGYPLVFPGDGVLVDDPGHPRDLAAAVRAVFEIVFDDHADAIWQEAAALLNPKNHSLSAWLASAFFEWHLKHHSKSGRKAPILWQLGLPSHRYSIWLYAHRLTRDSFFKLQSDIVEPKLHYEERQLTNLVQEAGASPSARQRKQIAVQETFVEELRVLLGEVRRVAPDWNPTLDDGVVLTMAPLWALVPHKSWQRELKSKWEELEAGKYDWSHIAMHLWPERVTAKCKSDRSLAIAHGLDQ